MSRAPFHIRFSFLRMPISFVRICWHQGIARALKILLQKIFPKLVVLSNSLSGLKFPPQGSSNVKSYIALFVIQPKISIVIPVYNSLWLKEAIQSAISQSYKNFELILVDDCSTNSKTLKVISEYANNTLVKIIRNKTNLNISDATNVGIQASSGEYIAFMDHDDLLHPDALAYFVRTLNNKEEADVYFSDEVIIGATGRIINEYKKSEISLDLLLAVNAVTHFCIMKKTSLLQIGLLHKDYDGAQDHDLMIRAAENGLRFCHLPYNLYGWRVHDHSMSATVRGVKNSKEKVGFPKAYLSGKKAIEDYLERNKIKAEVTADAYCWYRVKYQLPVIQEEVAIIVPFKDQVTYLRRLLTSMGKTSYSKYVIYLVNNRSEKEETFSYLESLKSLNNPQYAFVDFDEPFNYSRLHNQVISKIPNELLLFLNNDIEVKESAWLEAMLEHIDRPKVAAVGGKLLYADGSIQHAGMRFAPSIQFCAWNVSSEDGYFTKVQHEVAGVTAACMLIRRSIFQEVGGFDEVNFPIGFSDSDLCLKLIQSGYKIIYTPFAELYHHESMTRGVQEECYEKYNLFKRYIGDTPMIDRFSRTM